MGWDRKKGGAPEGYFYVSKRIPGKPGPIKIYKGRSTAGHEAAAEIERRRLGRLEAKRLLRAAHECTDEADRLAVELKEWADFSLTVWMVLTGHYRRRREWRRTPMAKEPKEGSLEWERNLHKNPVYVKNTILDLAKRAAAGEERAVHVLFCWLERHPEMRSLIRELDELATRVERAWVQKVCGDNKLSTKGTEDDLAAMRAKLLGPSASITDQILASSVLISHLAFQRASLLATQPTDKPEVREARERLMTIALKRLVAATKAWEQVATLKTKGLRPRGKIKLFESKVAT